MMHYALDAAQMRGVEERAVRDGVATIAELMERAGLALAAEVGERVASGSVVAVCGPGNNGGDGWVAARALQEAGRSVRVVSLCAPADLPADAAHAAAQAMGAGVRWNALLDADESSGMLAGADVVIDAIFGFGFRGPALGRYARAIGAIGASDAFVVSADMPSGVDSTTGAVTGAVVSADVTVTFSALKPGLCIYPGAAAAGDIVVADIGIPASLLRVPGALEVPESADLRHLLPVPSPQDHKGSRGRLGVVAGSRSYTGAAVLTVQGALRMGVGYVVAIAPESAAGVLRALLPSAIVRAMPDDEHGALAHGADVMSAVVGTDALVAGPGLSAGAGVTRVIGALLRSGDGPLLLDADALNAVAGSGSGLSGREAPLVITPHPGEAARLLGITTEEVQADRVAAARSLAGDGVVCLLKGARTIVAGPERTALVLAGNAGLARAGTGDVLSGMIGALLAQGVPPFDAAVLGAHLHGRAAQIGTRELTQTCFIATDITRFLPDAVRELLGG